MTEQQADAKIKQMIANGLHVTANTYYTILDMLMHGRKSTVVCTVYPRVKGRERD